jgi:hypothetical protein
MSLLEVVKAIRSRTEEIPIEPENKIPCSHT